MPYANDAQVVVHQLLSVLADLHRRIRGIDGDVVGLRRNRCATFRRRRDHGHDAGRYIAQCTLGVHPSKRGR